MGVDLEELKPFIGKKKFSGAKKYYFFKNGDEGLGYYLDKRIVTKLIKKKKKKKAKAEREEKLKQRKPVEEQVEPQGEDERTQEKAKESIEEQEVETKQQAPNDDESNDDEEDKKVSFESLGVVKELSDACEKIGWTHATPIQTEAIPPALEGRDLIALAETGSGKTGAFTLPMLQGLLNAQQKLYGVVLAPTRELAFQIHDVVKALGIEIGVKSVCIVGGVDMMTQAIALAKKPHIVVATPGRLIDHLENTKGFNLRQLKLLVLDEADRMLSMDFEEEINKLLQEIPRERNTYLFSATMTTKVAKLQRASLQDPVRVEVSSKYQTVKTLNQQYMFIPAKHKDCYLVYLLNELAGQTTLIFASTCAHAQKATMMLRNLGFQAICLHGQMSQPKRYGALNKFKNGERTILIATDVASRGIDIPAVDLVVNYDVPQNGKDYIHRVGRTARAGRSGRAVTLVTQYDVEVYSRIEQMIGKKLDKYPAEKETVLVMFERVFEAQRVAALEMRDAARSGKKGRYDDGEGAQINDLLDSVHTKKRKGKFQGRAGKRRR